MITDAAKRFQGLELSEIKWHRKFSTQTYQNKKVTFRLIEYLLDINKLLHVTKIYESNGQFTMT